MLEMVYVGERRLIGEVIGVSDDYTTIQVYENTAGLRIGEPVEPSGAPVCATPNDTSMHPPLPRKNSFVPLRWSTRCSAVLRPAKSES